MHALLENAITYSYDDSKVVVSGTVQRVSPNLTHPAVKGDELEIDLGSGQIHLADLGEAVRAEQDKHPAAEHDEHDGQTEHDEQTEKPTKAEADEASADSAESESESESESGAGDVEEPMPSTPADGTKVDLENGPVEPVFTPEILDNFTQPAETPAAAGTTVPPVSSSAGPAGPAALEGDSVAVTETTSSIPNWRIEERDNVRISVQDHGVGIPARDLDRIFERFYRVDHGRSRDTGGTGLGLSIVRHVANNHQGWVDVESREGEGSTFTLVLPVQGQGERVV
jgi:hypothetical protein